MKIKLGYGKYINPKLIARITQPSRDTAKIRLWTGKSIIVKLNSDREFSEYTFHGSFDQLKESIKRLKDLR